MQCIARECTLYILHRGAARRHQSCAILPLRESSARCPAPFSANHAAKSSPRPPVPPPGSIVKNVGRSLGMKALGSRCSGCTAAEDLNPRPSECSHPQKTRCSADDVAGFAQTLHWLSFCNCSSTRPAATCPTAMAMTKLRFEDTTAAQRLSASTSTSWNFAVVSSSRETNNAGAVCPWSKSSGSTSGASPERRVVRAPSLQARPNRGSPVLP